MSGEVADTRDWRETAVGWHPAGVYEQPPSRRRIGPALIAVLAVLAIAAGAGSYLVVGQVLAGGEATPTGDATTPDGGGAVGNQPDGGTAVGGVGLGTNPSTATPRPSGSPVATQASPQSTATATAKPADPATSCPAVTVKAVAAAGLNSELKLLRYVEVSQSGSNGEAWVCRNAAGVLFYQGHRKSAAFDVATGNDTILLGRGVLGKVDTEGDARFVAYNPQNQANPDDPDHTEYHVSATAFYYVKQPEGRRTDVVIVRTLPRA